MQQHHRRPSGLLILLIFCAALLAGLLPQASPAATDHQVRVVRIRDTDEEQRRQLVKLGIDLLELREGNDRFALLTAEQQAALAAAGWQLSLEVEQTAMLRRSGLAAFDPAYRSVEQTEALLGELAAQYPELASVIDYGDSWEKQRSGGTAGYDLLALRITNRGLAGPKPIFLLMAAIHARELTTSELATRFAEELLQGYGSDADISWMLDEHEVVIVPIANPDGRKLAEQGLLQRKNTNNTASGACAVPPTVSSQHGVDLNRNFDYQWGTIDGPALSPCAQTYPGSGPASEPETVALQALIRQLYGERASGAERDGVLISLHSYGELVLWPWGHSAVAAPDGAALQRLGRTFAAFNGYDAEQSIQLYPTSGTTDDWSYGELGIASYTFEIGPYGGPCGGFTPPYNCLDGGQGGNFWVLNRPALLYAARVARAPYSQPGGPQAVILEAVRNGATISVTVQLNGGEQPLQAAELALGASPYRGGAGLALQPVDGSFDGRQELAGVSFESNLNGPFYLLVRGQGADGVWGPIDAAWLPVDQGPWPQLEFWLPLIREET